MKQRDVGLFQSMKLLWYDTLGASIGNMRRGSPLFVRSNSKRMKISFFLASMDSFGGLGFARGDGSYKSTNQFGESLKNFP